MSAEHVHEQNEKAGAAWNTNAEFWDERMADGNDFFKMLVWPPTARLLGTVAGRRILDAACGNGVSSRKLAANGAHVVAFDFAEALIQSARARQHVDAPPIRYQVLDATDEQALLNLGERSYDGAICNMALFDMVCIAPLMRMLARLLVPGAPFVFSVLHPCFDNPGTSHVVEMTEHDGTIATQYSIKVWRYLTPTTTRAIAIPGQPEPQLLFHRPLQQLLGECFSAGFVVDGLEEAAFPAGFATGTLPLSWSGHYSEIPPVLVVRARNNNRE